MTNLDPVADRVVREAVDAYLDGHLAPQLANERAGETAFETKNSRYRLVDGVVVAAPDDSLIGAELVGWLIETARRSVVESAWQPGSRAVLVDRHRGRNIIVTSTTRLLHLEERAQRAASRPGDPAFLPRGVPVLVTSLPTYPDPRFPAAPPPHVAAVAAPPRAAVPAAPAPKRPSAIHLPPRPIASAAAVPASSPGRVVPPASSPRAVAVPGAPPSYGGAPPSSSGVTARPQAYAAEPPDGDAWEVTSSELVIEEPPPSVPDSGGAADSPIPLVRPVDPFRYGGGAPPGVPRPRR